MAGKKGMKHYSIEFRQKIVDLHLKVGISVSQLSEEYSLNPSQIKFWCKWFKQYGVPKQLTGKKRGRPTNKEETLEQEVKRLRMENEVLKKYHELLFEEMSKRK